MTDQQHDTDQVKDAHENAQGAQELKSSDVGQVMEWVCTKKE